jgi:hypothetical protein
MVGKIRTAQHRYASWVLLIAFAILLPVSIFCPNIAHAAQLQQRSLAIGSAVPGATTTNNFRFAYATTGTAVGSLMFEYCDSPLFDVPCTGPSGLDASHAVLTQQIGEGGYFMLTAQTNRIILTRAPAVLPQINPSEYDFSNVVNPSDAETFYVRISTYVSTDGSGPYTDFGSVAQATTTGQIISAEVPPYLKFCVGLTIATDCSTADGNLIDLGTLTSSRVSYGSSQMAAATNAQFGLIIDAYGTTMTSGNNVISALTKPTPSAPGNAQFGINLRANSNPGVGQEPSGGGVAVPTASYNVPNKYMFNSGDTIASSAAATDTKEFTASYIVNVPPDQTPGVYTATLTYICTASF